LHGNKLKEIDSDLFKGLTQLAVISLHDNLISEIHPKLFNDLKNLTSINLSFNLIKHLDSNLFKGFFFWFKKIMLIKNDKRKCN